MRNDFSTLDICKALQITREALRDWMTKGFILPTVAADGQGTRAMFNRSDVYSIELFRTLLNVGFNRSTAAGYVKEITTGQRHTKAPFRIRWLKLVIDKDFKVHGSTIILSDNIPSSVPMKLDYATGLDQQGLYMERGTKKSWRAILLIDFNEIVKDVDDALSRL